MLQCSHDTLLTLLIQFLLQLLLIYWVIKMGFVLYNKHISFKLALKQNWPSTFMSVVLISAFDWKLKLNQDMFIGVVSRQCWQCLLLGYLLDSVSMARLSYILRREAECFFTKKVKGVKLKLSYSKKELDRI